MKCCKIILKCFVCLFLGKTHVSLSEKIPPRHAMGLAAQNQDLRDQKTKDMQLIYSPVSQVKDLGGIQRRIAYSQHIQYVLDGKRRLSLVSHNCGGSNLYESRLETQDQKSKLKTISPLGTVRYHKGDERNEWTSKDI